VNRHSLFWRLSLFFVAAVAIAAVGYRFLTAELDKQYRVRQLSVAESMISLLRRQVHLDDATLSRNLENAGFVYYNDPDAAPRGLRHLFSTPPSIFPPEVQDSLAAGRLEFLYGGDRVYLKVNRAEHPFVVASRPLPSDREWVVYLFGSLLFLMLLFYFSVIRSLLPLKKLAASIRLYGEKGGYVPTASSGRDEIAYVANAFDEAIRKNHALTEARRLFMRNIMHELKTPITVGKLSLPFLEQSEETRILARAFMRMERLIEEMAHIEQVTSRTSVPKMGTCPLVKLVDGAKELMISLKGTVETEFPPETLIEADCEMMRTVFKNLIDNAFKYASDKRVVIRLEGRKLIFANRGTPWPETLRFETLLEPFMRDHGPQDGKSFGLGLYIVASILKAHGYGFSHEYRDGEHRFGIENLRLLS